MVVAESQSFSQVVVIWSTGDDDNYVDEHTSQSSLENIFYRCWRLFDREARSRCASRIRIGASDNGSGGVLGQPRVFSRAAQLPTRASYIHASCKSQVRWFFGRCFFARRRRATDRTFRRLRDLGLSDVLGLVELAPP